MIPREFPNSLPSLLKAPVLPYVKIKGGRDRGAIYEIHKEVFSIGRARENDLFLEDLAVSRFHASIIHQGHGVYAARDEGSDNGTKVNEQPLNNYQLYQLQYGDHIQLGQTVLIFRIK